MSRFFTAGRSRRALLRLSLRAGAVGAIGASLGGFAASEEIGRNQEAGVDKMSVTFEVSGHIALIGLNRPQKDNRLDPETYKLLSKRLYEVEHDANLRCAVLFGHGKHFSRGIDVEAFASTITAGVERDQDVEMIDPFGKSAQRFSKPLIAVVHGDTWNIGHELCLAADIRVAARDTNFGQTEASQARMPGSGATIRFVRDAGWGNAMRYMLTGENWDAETARRIGIVQEIAPDQKSALEVGIQIASKIAASAPLSIQATLASAHLVIDESEVRALRELNRQRQALYGTRDFDEGLRARKEGRVPQYEGR